MIFRSRSLETKVGIRGVGFLGASMYLLKFSNLNANNSPFPAPLQTSRRIPPVQSRVHFILLNTKTKITFRMLRNREVGPVLSAEILEPRQPASGQRWAQEPVYQTTVQK